MRYYQILVLACWLWIVTTSEADECVRNFWCNSFNSNIMIMEGYNFTCDNENNGYINIKCEDFDNGMPNCNVLYITDDVGPTSSGSTVTSKPICTLEDCESICKQILCTSAECGYTTVTISDSTASKAALNDKCNSTVVAALGALVGLLLVLLATVSAVLAWTCWLLKKRNGMKFNSEYQSSSGADHGQLVNPTYEGDDLLHLQPQQPIPAYETIAPHPRDGARLEFLEQEENGYHVLSREQRSNPETATNTQRMEMILEDSREESYSKLESREGSGSSKKANEEDNIGEYSKLETVNIRSTAPTDSTWKVSDATVESSDDSSEETEGKVLSIMDNKAFDDNGDDLQLENDDTEKDKEEAKREPPVITITPDENNTRKDSTDPETSTTVTEDGACV